MIVLACTYRKSNDDRIEKCRIVELGASCAKVRTNVELEFVLAGHEQLLRQQRVLGSPVVVRDGRRLELAATFERKQPDVYPGSRYAAGRVEYVCRKSSHERHYTYVCYCLASSICNENNNKANTCMSPEILSRRSFLKSSGALAGANYLQFLAPGLGAITQAACSARDEGAPYVVLEAGEARDFAAIAARIIPTTDTPGANEAGVIHFIDRAFDAEMDGQLEFARTALAEFNDALRAEHGVGSRLDELDEDTQDAFLKTREETPLFNFLRVLTIFGFFAMEKHGGNRGNIGWDVIGFVGDQGPWSYPFGYYDAQVRGDTTDGE